VKKPCSGVIEKTDSFTNFEGHRMKIAITGKGGVGKTTLTSLLAYAFRDNGFQVLAIDADPSPCLGIALGLPAKELNELTPIAKMDELIYERTGAQPGTTGGFFKMNPRVDDLPDRFSLSKQGIRILELGAVEMGGSGCICPESAMLRSLVTHVLLGRDEVVLLDMYAGVEHLGRATADAVDAMLVVVEPTARSLGTAEQIKHLAKDIKVEHIFIVGSKVRNEDDAAFIEENSPGLSVLGHLPADERVIEADRKGVAVYSISPELAQSAKGILEKLGVPPADQA
jgi:CO dehydrogenase maturation factor